MRIPAPLLLIFPTIASVGCFESSAPVEPYTINVSAPGIGVALGELAPVSISIVSTSHEDYGGCGAGPQLPTLTVDAVSCAPDCEVSAEHATSFTVSANSRGTKNVDLRLSTSD